MQEEEGFSVWISLWWWNNDDESEIFHSKQYWRQIEAFVWEDSTLPPFHLYLFLFYSFYFNWCIKNFLQRFYPLIFTFVGSVSWSPNCFWCFWNLAWWWYVYCHLIIHMTNKTPPTHSECLICFQFKLFLSLYYYVKEKDKVAMMSDNLFIYWGFTMIVLQALLSYCVFLLSN